MRAFLAILPGALTIAACGGCGPDGGGGFDAAAGAPCAPEDTASGEATYYDADGSGNCSFDPTPNDLLVAAMNTDDYQGSRACGACVHIVGPEGEVTVRIVDRCPGCATGDLDLSPEAFSELAPLPQGRIPITWRYVPCQVSGPITYQVKDGSSQYWAAIQVRNTRYAVASLEARPPGADWQPLERQLYNYFVAPDGLGPDPVDLRVTDVHGHPIEDPGLAIDTPGAIEGAAQFPACAGD